MICVQFSPYHIEQAQRQATQGREAERYAVADHVVAQLKERSDPWELTKEAPTKNEMPTTRQSGRGAGGGKLRRCGAKSAPGSRGCHEPRGCAEGTHDRGREGMATARHRRSALCQGRSVAAASTVTGTGGRPGGAGIRRQKAARGSAEKRVRPREQAAPRSRRRRQGRQGHLERVGGQTILTHQLAHGGEQTGRRPVAFGSKTGSKIAFEPRAERLKLGGMSYSNRSVAKG